MSTELVEAALILLRQAGVMLDAGLSRAEREAVEVRFGFTFAPEHAQLLAACLPIGVAWPDWRHGTEESLRGWLDAPVEGVLFDVSTNGFWPASWGRRPEDPQEAIRRARSRLLLWPRMVPVRGHRYLPAGPQGRAVFSIHQSDVVYYGSDLLDYLQHELGSSDVRPVVDPQPLWPWSDLARGADDVDL